MFKPLPSILCLFLLFCSLANFAYPQSSSNLDSDVLLVAQLGNLNCGLKPLPELGYEIGRCINGQWEQVSKSTSSNLNCGLKPLPQIGYEIGRCINGQWEQVSK